MTTPADITYYIQSVADSPLLTDSGILVDDYTSGGSPNHPSCAFENFEALESGTTALSWFEFDSGTSDLKVNRDAV